MSGTSKEAIAQEWLQNECNKPKCVCGISKEVIIQEWLQNERNIQWKG